MEQEEEPASEVVTAGNFVEDCIWSTLPGQRKAEESRRPLPLLISEDDDSSAADDDDMVDSVDDEWKAKPVVELLMVHTFLGADSGGGLSSALLKSIPFETTTDDDDLANAEIEVAAAVVRRFFSTNDFTLGDGSTLGLGVLTTFKADRRLLGADGSLLPTDDADRPASLMTAGAPGDRGGSGGTRPAASVCSPSNVDMTSHVCVSCVQRYGRG